MHSQGDSTWFVCLSVCHPEFWHYRLCGGHSAILSLRGHENQRSVFPETAAFQRYGVKTSVKATGIPIAHAPLPSGYGGAHASC